ncbi:TPA: HAD family hydrolase [Staphylococcus aureus]
MNRKIDLIIFDLDNTLFHFKHLWLKATRKTFEEYALFKDINYSDFIELYIKYDLYFWKEHTAGNITLDELRELRLTKTLNHFGLNISQKEANKYFKVFFTKLLSTIKINRKMNDMLLSLKENISIAILTNGKNIEQNIKIDNLGIRKIFGDNIFISQSIGYEKPDSNAFLYVTSKLDVPPEKCLFIGDSFENDIKGALNVNMPAIWLTNSGEKKAKYIKNQLYTCNDKIEVLLRRILDNNFKDFSIYN